jgi:hypothetical protein
MIEETKDYWLYDDYLIFKPSFNKQLNNKLLSSYNKIIFSNYNEQSISIIEDNKFSNLCEKKIKCFNIQLSYKFIK